MSIEHLVNYLKLQREGVYMEQYLEIHTPVNELLQELKAYGWISVNTENTHFYCDNGTNDRVVMEDTMKIIRKHKSNYKTLMWHFSRPFTYPSMEMSCGVVE